MKGRELTERNKHLNLHKVKQKNEKDIKLITICKEITTVQKRMIEKMLRLDVTDIFNNYSTSAHWI